jgi:hypothetical protein
LRLLIDRRKHLSKPLNLVLGFTFVPLERSAELVALSGLGHFGQRCQNRLFREKMSFRVSWNNYNSSSCLLTGNVLDARGCPALDPTHVQTTGGKLDVVPAQSDKLEQPPKQVYGAIFRPSARA